MTDLLLVEDDPAIVSSLSDFLTQEGFTVTAASGQAAASRILETRRFHLALLDVTLGDGGGFFPLRLHQGPIPHPGDFPHRPGRRERHRRRSGTGRRRLHRQALPSPGAGEPDPNRTPPLPQRGRSPCAWDPSRWIPPVAWPPETARTCLCPPLEYRLLLLFCSNPGVVLSRNRILDEIWDLAGDFVTDNTLTVYIKRLRDKIEPDPQAPTLIRTVRGLGYQAGERL